MTSEVKLLTVQMAEALGAMSPEARVRMLRERGLIAPEPVDPLLIEAREICARVCEGWADIPAERAHHYRQGSHDDEADVAFALAALRRGMELRPQLTRERVREAVVCAFERDKCAAIAWRDYSDPYTRVEAEEAEAFVTRLHAALTGQGA